MTHEVVIVGEEDSDHAPSTIGTVAGNRYTITAPAMVQAEQSPGDKGGIVTRDLKLKLAESVVDDEWSLALT